ncbi:hypothetical protein E2C01_100198 [Portunus trituberculatus]|uniref:Uncharacterized protein n=1 Tax=Portunus trituberculatus TaxID=210409 RepID=A0A5B7KIT0_PORTR|nr:hypothetical protein [Portunus trituberculatus]
MVQSHLKLVVKKIVPVLKELNEENDSGEERAAEKKEGASLQWPEPSPLASLLSGMQGKLN